jgi:hypothetical protein
VAADEQLTTCSGCGAVYHSDCWEENQGCAVYGCTEVPPTEKLENIEIPASYWGRETKPCPACDREIQAAALRCRHCGATFPSHRPQDRSDYDKQQEFEQNQPTLRRSIILLFVLSIIPCTAPLAGVIGSGWVLVNRSQVRLLPPIYSALCKIAVAVAIGQTLLMALMMFLFEFSKK